MRFVPEVGQSLTLAFAEAAGARRRAGLPILSLGLGEPDFPTPPALVEAVTAVLGEGNSRYSGALGVAGLRDRVAEKLRIDNGVNVDPGAVLIAAGAKQALSLTLMAMLEPGDEIVVITPSFVSFVPQALLAEPECTVRLVGIDRTTHALSLERLGEAFSPRTRAVLINTPNNPAGFQLDAATLEGVLELARRHDAWVIADEVYEKLVFGDAPHVSVGAFEDAPERVVTINGFSKSHALTGWRLGYAALPAALVARVRIIQQHVNTNTATFVQEAVARAWDLDCPHLDAYRRELAARAARVRAWADASDALACRVPSAGFFAFVDIGALGIDSNAFCAGLLRETGVATTPGIAFGRDWDDHVRLSFAVPDDTLARALDLMDGYVAELGRAGS